MVLLLEGSMLPVVFPPKLAWRTSFYRQDGRLTNTQTDTPLNGRRPGPFMRRSLSHSTWGSEGALKRPEDNLFHASGGP